MERWNPLLGIAASSGAQRSGAGSSARNHSSSAYRFFNPGTSPGGRAVTGTPLCHHYSFYPPQISWSNPSIYLSSWTKVKSSSSAKFVVVFVRLFAVTPASLMRLMVHSPTVSSAAKHHGINGGLPATTQHPGLSNWPPSTHSSFALMSSMRTRDFALVDHTTMSWRRDVNVISPGPLLLCWWWPFPAPSASQPAFFKSSTAFLGEHDLTPWQDCSVLGVLQSAQIRPAEVLSVNSLPGFPAFLLAPTLY